jgi:hypothetical protein
VRRDGLAQNDEPLIANLDQQSRIRFSHHAVVFGLNGRIELVESPLGHVPFTHHKEAASTFEFPWANVGCRREVLPKMIAVLGQHNGTNLVGMFDDK